MTDSKNSSKKKKPPYGPGKIYSLPSGAVSITTDQLIGKKITLPRKTRVKITWIEEEEKIIIEPWDGD